MLGQAWGDAGAHRRGVRLVVRAEPGRQRCCRLRGWTGRSSVPPPTRSTRMVIGGEERLMGFACHAVTDPVARGLGIFTALQRHLEERARGARLERRARVREPGDEPDVLRRARVVRPRALPDLGAAGPRPRRDAAAGRARGRGRRRRGLGQPRRPRHGPPRLAVPRLAARVRPAALAGRLRSRLARQAVRQPGDRSRLRPGGACEGDPRPPPPGGEGLAGRGCSSRSRRPSSTRRS